MKVRRMSSEWGFRKPSFNNRFFNMYNRLHTCLQYPVVYSTDRSKALVPVLVLLFVALWLILRGDLF